MTVDFSTQWQREVAKLCEDPNLSELPPEPAQPLRSIAFWLLDLLDAACLSWLGSCTLWPIACLWDATREVRDE